MKDKKVSNVLNIPAGAKVHVEQPEGEEMIRMKTDKEKADDVAIRAVKGSEGYILISVHEGGIRETVHGLSVHAIAGLVEAFRIRVQEEIRGSIHKG